MAIDTIPLEGLEGGLHTDEFTFTVPNPPASTIPLTIAVLRPFRIDRVYFTVTSSDDTGTCNIDILKNSVALTDFTAMDVDNTRQYEDDDGDAANSVAYEDVLELDINSTGGTDREYLTITVHITYL